MGEFYSIAITKNLQKADTGSKMIHLGKYSFSKIISKGISSNQSMNCYRGLVDVKNCSFGSKKNTQCDSIILGKLSSANTFPYIEVKSSTAMIEHEAKQIFYLQQRGMDFEESLNLLLGGFCKDVIEELPLEFFTEINDIINSSSANMIG